MTVKGIFKILIGTLLIIVGVSLIIELFNVSTSGLQLNQTSKMAGKQACTLFTQESYKKYSTGGSVDSGDILDSTGALYMSGKFYPEGTTEQVYSALYTSTAFKSWLQSQAATDGKWYNLKRINQALNESGTLTTPFGQPGYNDAMTAKLYASVMMTPVNLGIPYLDEDTLNKMFKWNLAQLLSNCNPNSIRADDSGEKYVAFRGFRVYADLAKISELEYKTFDMEDSSGSSDREEFFKITNVDPGKLGFQYDTRLKSTVNVVEDDRNRICLVGVSYEVPMAYDGITPIKDIFNYVWNTEVEGLKGGSSGAVYRQWNDSQVSLKSGGLYGNAAVGVLPVPGKLIYYIIR